MSKKDMESKLGDMVRQAKGESAPPPAPNTVRLPKAKPAPQRARQTDQAPPADSGDPWQNLYPERIWPD
ncbi:MAG: hypothetical protein AB1469_07145 [Pseudomonadota bacterium]